MQALQPMARWAFCELPATTFTYNQHYHSNLRQPHIYHHVSIGTPSDNRIATPALDVLSCIPKYTNVASPIFITPFPLSFASLTPRTSDHYLFLLSSNSSSLPLIVLTFKHTNRFTLLSRLPLYYYLYDWCPSCSFLLMLAGCC